MQTQEHFALRAFAGRITVVLGVILSLTGGGCRHSPTAPETDFGANDPAVIVALGDSITFGVMDTDVENCNESRRNTGGFCPPLQELTGKIVLNAGVCGELSADGVDRITESLYRWRPGVILIDYSPNDLLFRTGAVIGNLRIMIEAARANQTVPVIGTLVPATGIYEGLNPAIANLNYEILLLCDELGVECADHHKAFLENLDFQESPYALLSVDGLHPNHEGYRLMAETWRKSLKRVY